MHIARDYIIRKSTTCARPAEADAESLSASVL